MCEGVLGFRPVRPQRVDERIGISEVVMTAAFVGYKVLLDASGGVLAIAVLGALVATTGAFGPSFVFIRAFSRTSRGSARTTWFRRR